METGRRNSQNTSRKLLVDHWPGDSVHAEEDTRSLNREKCVPDWKVFGVRIVRVEKKKEETFRVRGLVLRLLWFR